MAKFACQVVLSVIGGVLCVALLWCIARFIPPLGLLLHIPNLIGLELLEDQGYPTLQGSPDGWPIPTRLGLWIIGLSWWGLCSLLVMAILRVRHRRAKIAAAQSKNSSEPSPLRGSA